jgi:hypothetical protein
MIEGMSKGFIELFDDSIGGKSYIYIHRSTSSNDSSDLKKILLQEIFSPSQGPKNLSIA